MKNDVFLNVLEVDELTNKVTCLLIDDFCQCVGANKDTTYAALKSLATSVDIGRKLTYTEAMKYNLMPSEEAYDYLKSYGPEYFSYPELVVKSTRYHVPSLSVKSIVWSSYFRYMEMLNNRESNTLCC